MFLNTSVVVCLFPSSLYLLQVTSRNKFISGDLYKLYFSLFQYNLGLISFDTVITQVGGVWNGVAHNFLIPAKGMYFFQLTIMAVNGEGGAFIRRDNTNIQEAFTPNTQITGTAAAVLELETFTQMSAWLGRGQLTNRAVPHCHTHYTGFMVFPM